MATQDFFVPNVKEKTYVFQVIFEEHYSKLYALAYHITGRHHDAEDALQSAAEKILSLSDERLLSIGDKTAYIYGLVRNQSRQLVRREKNLRKRHEVFSLQRKQVHSDFFEEIDQSKDDTQFLQDALAELPEHYFDVIFLHYIEGVSFKEVGLLLGRNEEAVKKQAQRGMKKLRVSLERRRVRMDAASLLLLLAAMRFEDLNSVRKFTELYADAQESYQNSIQYSRLSKRMISVSSTMFIMAVALCSIFFYFYKSTSHEVNVFAVLDEEKDQEEIIGDKETHQNIRRDDIEWRLLNTEDFAGGAFRIEQQVDVTGEVVHAGEDFRFLGEVPSQIQGRELMWVISSQDYQSLSTIPMMKQQFMSFEIRGELRVEERYDKLGWFRLGMLSRGNAEKPAPREILFQNRELLQNAQVVTQYWRSFSAELIGLETLDGKGAWSRMRWFVDGEMVEEVDIQLPSINTYALGFGGGLKLNLRNLKIRERSPESRFTRESVDF